MSAPGDLDDDDYVAKLLVEDARQSSVRYSSMGMSALLPKRSPNSTPKPNTRFLKSLVRDVTSHNAQLKRKEEEEAKMRLRRVRDAADVRDRDRRHSSKRRRLQDENDEGAKSLLERHERHRHSRRSRSPDRDRDADKLSRRKQRRHEVDDSHYEHRHRKHRHHTSSRRLESRSRSRSGGREREESGRQRSQHKHNGKSRGHSSREPSGTGDRGRSLEPSERRDRSQPRTVSPTSTSSSDSDPLSAHIGPHPLSDKRGSTTCRRGRGFERAQRNPTSNIDAHFSSTYDPSQEAAAATAQGSHSDDEVATDDDEWTSALSALRDRRVWRAKQTDRMREAGFTQEEITRWQMTGSSSTSQRSQGGDADANRDLRDVRWSKKGEEREWDVGKTATH